MDKQIIVDGVDVSGCGYYDPNADKESHFLHDCKKEHAPCWSCASMPGCLYKKYKRKEQECEMLKKIINEAKNSKLDLNSFFAIEATVGEYQLELDQLKAENDLFRICHDNEQAKRRKYEQTLIEIKEIAERGFKLSQCNCGAKAELDLILQKISEVGNE